MDADVRTSGRFPRWWVPYGAWLGPGAVLAAGVNLVAESYTSPLAWGALLQRAGGWVALFVAAAMLLSSADLLAREREAGRPRLVELPEGTDAYAELQADELDAAARGKETVVVRRGALSLVLSGYGAMRAVLNTQVRLDDERRSRASDG